MCNKQGLQTISSEAASSTVKGRERENHFRKKSLQMHILSKDFDMFSVVYRKTSFQILNIHSKVHPGAQEAKE